MGPLAARNPYPSPADLLPIVLVGGLGTRLRDTIGDLPKPLAPVSGTPFLEHLLRYLSRAGFKQAVLAVGYGAETVAAHFGDGNAVSLRLTYSREARPLGTGGAIRLACERAQSWPVLVLNGDSFVEVDLAAMFAAHCAKQARATVALASVPDAARFGRVRLASDDTILQFEEKTGGGPGLINAGVYILEREATAAIPVGQSSLELDVLPRLLGRGMVGFASSGFFVDIGVSEDYRRLVQAPDPFLEAVMRMPR